MPARRIECRHCGARAFREYQTNRTSWGKYPTIRIVYACERCGKKTVWLFIEESAHEERRREEAKEWEALKKELLAYKIERVEKQTHKDKDFLERQVREIRRKLLNIEQFAKKL